MRVARVVDLSHPVTENTQVYPGDPIPHIVQHSTIEQDGFNLVSIAIGSQSGTHVDAPYHFDKDTARIDELDLTLFVGQGRVLNCGNLAPREKITAKHLGAQLNGIKAGEILLFKTGWAQHYGTELYFHNPYLDPELVALLLSSGIRTFGLDAINIDETPSETRPGNGFLAHHLIAKAGGVICENLTNLEAVNFPAPLISILPIKFIGIDGAPVRAVAIDVEADAN